MDTMSDSRIGGLRLVGCVVLRRSHDANGNLRGGDIPTYHTDGLCRLMANGPRTEPAYTTDLFETEDGRQWVAHQVTEMLPSVGLLHVQWDAHYPHRAWRRVRPCTLCGDGVVSSLLAEDRSWAEEGACWGTAHPGFFEDPRRRRLTEAELEALAMCARCPVIETCRDYWRRLHVALGGVSGIGGGETERQRREWFGSLRQS